MNRDVAAVAPAHPPRTRAIRTDGAAQAVARPPGVIGLRLVLAGLALGFVVVGVAGLEVGPLEARLGLAAGERIGPLGQVLGYWAPDLWPAQVVPSLVLARLEPWGRPTTAAVRWPAALAGILGGWLLARGMLRALGLRAAIVFGCCWFGCVALIDRSAGAGLDLISGLATLAAIDRLLTRGSDGIAGLWSGLAFLAGGWPPLLVIGLALIVIGRPGAGFSLALLLPPVVIAVLWSAATIGLASAEVWAAALTLPLTEKPAWSLGLGVLALGLPWSPFSLLALSRVLRANWPADGRRWVLGWVQVGLTGWIAGTLIPGLSPSARPVVLAGLLVAAAAGLEAAWTQSLSPAARRTFFVLFSAVLALWLITMTYAGFLWNFTMPYYRVLGVVMGVLILAVIGLGWSALGWNHSRRGLVTLALLAVGLKLAHAGYYAPEWNYRRSQGPWGRAIGQWFPRRWPVYTFHDWPPDLCFFIGRPVRQLHSPRFLNYLPGSESRYVLLLTSEFDNWPRQAPPIAPVARFQDPSGEHRILARTAGLLPVPGQTALRYLP
jgi:hypothetical protein